MTTYASDKSFQHAEPELGVRLAFKEGMSFADFADTLSEVESIFAAAAKEVTGRNKKSNGKKLSGLLSIKEFRPGSLEIVADPYFQGVVSGVVANAVFAVFVYCLKRIGGRPNNADGHLPNVSPEVFTPEKAKEVATSVVASTTNQRKRLKTKYKIFGLRLSVRLNAEWIDIDQD